MKEKIILLFLVLLPFQAFAQWTSGVQITEIIVEGGSDGKLVTIKTGHSLQQGCPNYHSLNASNARGKMIFSLLLTVKTLKVNASFLLKDEGGGARCSIIAARSRLQ